MKKTEKIELRVDHAEKERLSSIAERRGQTVSDVVRDALAGELGVARVDYPRWPGFVAITACCLALISVSANFWPSDSHDAAAQINVAYPQTIEVTAMMNEQNVSFHLPVADDGQQSLNFIMKNDQTYRLDLTTRLDTQGTLMWIDAAGCVEINGICDADPIQSLSLDRQPYRSSGADIRAKVTQNDYIALFANAKTERPKITPMPISPES